MKWDKRVLYVLMLSGGSGLVAMGCSSDSDDSDDGMAPTDGGAQDSSSGDSDGGGPDDAGGNADATIGDMGGSALALPACTAYCDYFIRCDVGPVDEDTCDEECLDGFFVLGTGGTGCDAAVADAESCFDGLSCDDGPGQSACLAELAGAGTACSGILDQGPCDCSECPQPGLVNLCEGVSSALCRMPATTEEECCMDAFEACGG
ncbi:MAG: hypothetical protein ACFB9M_20285 [Myxococcota bacterium]